MRKSELANIIALLENTFEGKPWHGPSVIDVLKEIDPSSTSVKSGKAHTIAQLVSHMTVWRTFVAARLEGEKFKITEEMNFPENPDWNQSVADLKTSQQKLLKALHAFPENKLHELVFSAKYDYTYYAMIHGAIHHDLYHLGQIIILQRTLVS